MPVVNQVQYKQDVAFNQGSGATGRSFMAQTNQSILNAITKSPDNGNQTTTAASLEPSDGRLSKASLKRGGEVVSKASTQDPKVQFGTTDESGNDWRVRISINPNSKILYNDPDITSKVSGLLAPLRHTDGFIFPYVPSVTVSHAASYSSVPLTHTNYAQYFYESSSVGSISISGEFAVQNLSEAKYFLAAIYFFRACTKMFYGVTKDYQGSPPPIVYLNGYGQHYLPNVPCVVTNFSHVMPNDVDYLEVNTTQSIDTSTRKNAPAAAGTPAGLAAATTGGGYASSEITTETVNTAFNRVPTASTLSLTLQPIISRTQAIRFDYKEFARGGLIVGKGNPFPGGFL